MKSEENHPSLIPEAEELILRLTIAVVRSRGVNISLASLDTIG